MRASGADTAVILHASSRYALAARLAGIKLRFGYGIGRQRRHLNAGHYLDKAALSQHAIDRVSRFAEINGFGLSEPVWAVHPRTAARKEAERCWPHGQPQPADRLYTVFMYRHRVYAPRTAMGGSPVC